MKIDNQNNEGWISLGIVALLIISIALILWTPDVEAIGSWIYEVIR